MRNVVREIQEGMLQEEGNEIFQIGRFVETHPSQTFLAKGNRMTELRLLHPNGLFIKIYEDTINVNIPFSLKLKVMKSNKMLLDITSSFKGVVISRTTTHKIRMGPYIPYNLFNY